jgi:bacteriorhodopsin
MTKKKFVVFVIVTTIGLILFLLFVENIIYPGGRSIVKILAFIPLIAGLVVGSVKAYKQYVK